MHNSKIYSQICLICKLTSPLLLCQLKNSYCEYICGGLSPEIWRWRVIFLRRLMVLNTHIHSFFDMCHRYWISALVCIIIVVKTKLTFLVTQSDFACYTVLCTSRQKSISPRQMVCIDIIIIGLSVAKGVPVKCSVFLAPFSNWGSTSAGRNPKVPKTVSQKAHSPPHVHLQGPIHNKF